MISTKGRLADYKKALAVYKKSLGKDYDTKRKLLTNFGFCNYFGLLGEFQISTRYPELMKQSPNKIVAMYYWYKQGAIAPRIKCLERAIELCEINLRNSK